MSNWSWPWPGHHTRLVLARHLTGRGVELGPGHLPFPLPTGVTAAYVDKWQPDDNRDMFPELGSEAMFPQPDVVCDFDTERLNPLGVESQDFVIASHVLEHLADPLGLLVDIHRVLRVGGVAVILLPDRTRTFDSERSPTPLEHLIEEHQAGVTVVSDEHMVDFLTKAGEGANFTRLPDGGADELERFYDWHRQRSIHVHCWHEDEFAEVLRHAIAHMGLRWQFVDGVIADDEQAGMEFGYVLRREESASDPSDLAARFGEDYRRWLAHRRALHATVDELHRTVARLQATPSLPNSAPDAPRQSPGRRAYQLAKRISGRLGARA